MKPVLAGGGCFWFTVEARAQVLDTPFRVWQLHSGLETTVATHYHYSTIKEAFHRQKDGHKTGL